MLPFGSLKFLSTQGDFPYMVGFLLNKIFECVMPKASKSIQTVNISSHEDSLRYIKIVLNVVKEKAEDR